MIYDKLVYPLNVYALAVLLDEGYVSSLHYGKGDPYIHGLADVQAKATTELLKLIPLNTETILEVGPGLGTTGRLLKAQGYTYKALCPDPVQAAYCSDLGLSIQNYENYDTTDTFDCLLFQESYQYFNHSDLLTKAAKLIRPGGSLVIADEMPPEQRFDHDLFHNEYVFYCSTQYHLTLTWLIDAIRWHRAGIAELLPPTIGAKIPTLLSQLEEREEEYKAGKYTYRLVRLQRK